MIHGSIVQGFLNLNKSAGLTSHDCVARVRRLLRTKRVGHGGTLDPAATGVLPIAVGRATRLLQFLRHDKAYRATIRLGMSTSTDDLEGEVLAADPVPQLDRQTVEAALAQFQGTIAQIPPNYSAVQVNGQRLYDLARAGKPVEAPVRTVEVYSLEVLAWRGGDFPELEVAIACGGGTYIRSIARDLGQVLNTGGTLATLLRTESSGFSLDTSLTLEQLEQQLEAGTFEAIAPDLSLHHLPLITLPADEARRWCLGQRIAQPSPISPESLGPQRVQDETGQLLGVGQLELPRPVNNAAESPEPEEAEPATGTVLHPKVVLVD